MSTSQCADPSASQWMLNSDGDNPCQVAQRILQTCQPDAAISTLSTDYGCYKRPNTGPSECCCSSITYALYSACWECQTSGDFTKAVNTTYQSFVSQCTMPYISTYPASIALALSRTVSIPEWATIPPMGNTLWDINAAKAKAGAFGASATTSVTVQHFPTSPASDTASSSSSSSRAGVIAGCVIGVIAAVLLIGGLVFYFLFWRRKRRQEQLAPSTIHRSLQMSHPNAQSQLPPHSHAQAAPLIMQNEKPRSGQQPNDENENHIPPQGAIEGAQWYFKLIPWRRRKVEHAKPGARLDLAEEPVSPVSIGGKSHIDPTMAGGVPGMIGGRPGSLGYQYAGYQPAMGGENGSIGHQAYSQQHHGPGYGQVDPESPPPPPVVHVTPLTTPIPSRQPGYYGHGVPPVESPRASFQANGPPSQQQLVPQQQPRVHDRPLPIPPSANSSPTNQNPFTDASIGQLQPIITTAYPTLSQNRAAVAGSSSHPTGSGSKRAGGGKGKNKRKLQVIGRDNDSDDSGSDAGGLPPSKQYLAEMAQSDARKMDEKAVLAQREREEEARQAAAAAELHRRRAHLAPGATVMTPSSAPAAGSHDSHNTLAMQPPLPTPAYSYPSPPIAGPMDASRSQPHLYPHPDSAMFPAPGSAPVAGQFLHQQPRQYVDPRFTPPRITPALMADEARREEQRIQEALRMAEERRKSVKNWVEESRQSMRGGGTMAERLEGPNTVAPALSDAGHGSAYGGAGGSMGHGVRIDLLGNESGGGAMAPSSYKPRTGAGGGGGRW